MPSERAFALPVTASGKLFCKKADNVAEGVSGSIVGKKGCFMLHTAKNIAPLSVGAGLTDNPVSNATACWLNPPLPNAETSL